MSTEAITLESLVAMVEELQKRKLYSVEMLCEIIPLEPSSIRNKITRGEFGETVNDGKRHLVTQQGLDNWLEQRKGEPIPYKRHCGGGTKKKSSSQVAEKLRME